MAIFSLTHLNDNITGTNAADFFDGDFFDDNPGGRSGGVDILDGGAGDDLFQLNGFIDGSIGGSVGTDTLRIHNDQIGAFHGLRTTTFTGMEVLDVDVVNGLGISVAQLSSFENILNSAGTQVNLIISDAGGVFDFSDRMDVGDGVALEFDWRCTSGFTITGSMQDDYIVASAFNDQIYGAGGDDLISGLNADRPDGDDSYFGQEGNDRLVGGYGNDLLDGGVGADEMAGMSGDDTYIVDSLGDIVRESDGNGGYDVVMSYITFSLDGSYTTGVENLALLGERNIYGTGNHLGNAISGNSGLNTLRGMDGDDKIAGLLSDDRLSGGAGNDTLDGGLGADYLSGGTGSDRASYLNSTTAVKVHLANSSVNTGEAAGDSYNSIENLTGSNFNDSLIGTNGANRISGANGNDVINGLTGNDLIVGGAGNDRIYGYLGNDTLEGDAGNDTFIFHAALGATNVDTITDFNIAQDTIELWNDVFTVLGSGPLDPNQFKDNITGVRESDDRIIYNSNSGSLFYDADGLGGAAAMKIATLTGSPTLTAADFIVV